MRNSFLVQSGVTVLAVAAFTSTAPLSAREFSYPDFRAPSHLIFQGDAAVVDRKVRLVPADVSKAGGLWLEGKQFVADGFETTFQFQLTDKRVYGADGLAFILQNGNIPQLGRDGNGMGFGGVSNVVAVKFDPYHYRNAAWYKFDEVALMAGKLLNTTKTDPPTIASVEAEYTDEQIHTAMIRYQPGTIRIYLDNLETPIITASLNLSEVIDLDRGRVWVGLTAATGADYNNHDVISWSFKSPDAPAMEPATASAKNSSTPVRGLYAAAPAPDALPPDPAFGHRLPSDIGLNHSIEASSDLVHWTIVTNALLYFRDPDSTNYDRRFYRFRTGP